MTASTSELVVLVQPTKFGTTIRTAKDIKSKDSCGVDTYETCYPQEETYYE